MTADVQREDVRYGPRGRGIRWPGVFGGATTTGVLLVGLDMADWANHYLLAFVMSALIGVIVAIVTVWEAERAHG